MEVGETLYVAERELWRKWLENNHSTAKEIWLIFYTKKSGHTGITYNEALEEALCYGWIDSIVKKFDTDSRAQRFTPRRKKSAVSEMNKERIRRLVAAGKMTRFGLESIQHHLTIDGSGNYSKPEFSKFIIPDDILEKLKEDPVVWKNFMNFPESYKNIRIGYIDGARKRLPEFEKRLKYFIKMTSENKRFGMVQ